MTTIPICEHTYHFDCLEKWLKDKGECPICRRLVRKCMVEHFHGVFEVREDRDSNDGAENNNNNDNHGGDGLIELNIQQEGDNNNFTPFLNQNNV